MTHFGKTLGQYQMCDWGLVFNIKLFVFRVLYIIYDYGPPPPILYQLYLYWTPSILYNCYFTQTQGDFIRTFIHNKGHTKCECNLYTESIITLCSLYFKCQEYIHQ